MKNKDRLNRVDELRGFTLISMILYHFMWDLKYIALLNMEWYTGPFGYVWQKSICISFIFISGFCFSMGKNRIKRSALIFVCGALISAVTLILMPENRIIFGILTFIGSAGFITFIIDKLHTKLESKLEASTLNITMIIGSLLLFIVFFNVNNGYIYVPSRLDLPKYLYKGYVETYLGFPAPSFFSTDYFSIFPWIFLYLVGYYSQRVICRSDIIISFLKKDKFHFISEIGRKSLIIYMLHQPVLYMITLIIQQIK